MNRYLSQRISSGAGVVLLGLCASASAVEVFRSVDGNGVVAFSDLPGPGAERLVLESPVPADERALARQQAVLEQQLAVAKSLEDSRLARARARTERLRALAELGPRVVYQRAEPTPGPAGGIYYQQWRYWPGHRPWRPGGPGHPAPPARPGKPVAPPGGDGSRLNPPQRSVPLPPLPGQEG